MTADVGVNDAETVTKLEAAERQIRTAIRLFFDDDYSVSILTLARAGAEVLRDLGKPRGILDEFGLDSGLVTPEGRKRWITAIRKPQNFLKHANNDPHAVLKLKDEVVHWHLFNAVVLLEHVGEKETPETFFFFHWFSAENSDLIAEEHRDETLMKLKKSGILNASKAEIRRQIEVGLELEVLGCWPPGKEPTTG